MSTCRVCGTEVNGGEFCGRCGARRTRRRGDGPDWLRLSSFAAAPREHVLLPILSSSLFPQLPVRTVTAFRVGLAFVVTALAGAAVFRLPGGLIATVTAGIPLLFVLYLRQAGYVGRLTSRLVGVAVLGIVLGAAFALVSGALVSRSYDVPLESGVAAVHLRTAAAGVSAIAALVALAPAVIVRIFAAGKRESLRGFAVGALGALAVAAAALAVRMFAQLNSGLIDRDQPLSDLLIEAGIRGVTVPVIAAAAGGMIGAALWFKSDRRGPVRWVLLFFAAMSVLAHVWLGEEDAAGISQWAKVAWHVAVALIAVVLLRVGLQLALLNEVSEVDAPTRPEPCTYCGNTVSDTVFCPACGVAMAGRQAAAPQRTISTGRLVMTWTAVVAVLALGLVGLSVQTAKPDERYLCPPNCGRPPMGQPMAVNPVFTAADGAFAVSYPSPGAAYSVTTDGSGVTAQFMGGDGGVMRLFGEPAHGRSPEDVAAELLDRTYPDSQVAYAIPNTLVGYRPGYGVALDDWPDGANVVDARTRILIMVAVKDDLALIAAAAGPYHVFGSNSGPPTGASLELAQDMGKYVNSFRWRGDPVR